MAEHDGSPFAGYLRQVTAQLAHLTPAQRTRIMDELQAHLEDAASEQGRDPADPAMQAAMIRTLGPAHKLGREMARAYSREQQMSVLGWRFWLLWTLGSGLVWAITSPLGYGDGTMWRMPMSGVLMTLLHILILQQHVAQANWWRRGLLGFCGPWLIAMVVYWLLPWESFTEARAELTLFASLAALGIISGIGQWAVLRPFLRAAPVWLVVPFVTLLLSFMGELSVNVRLIPLGMMRQLDAIGGWAGMFVLLSFLFGLLYGAISGTALLALTWRRPARPQPA